MDKDLVKRRFNAAKAARQPIEHSMHIAYMLTNPGGSPRAVKGKVPDRSFLFDSTLGEGLSKLVATTVDNLIPRTNDYFGWKISEDYLEMGLPTGALEVFLARQLRKFFQALNGSNFRLATGESLQECFTAGGGGIGIKLDKKKNLYFTSIPARELYYSDNGDCVIDVVFREWEQPARMIASRYKSVPDWIKDLAENKPDDTVKIVEAMVPGKKDDTFEYSVWTSKWEKLHTQTTNYPPFIVYRSERTSSSAYGDSFVRRAAADGTSINQMMADTLDNSALTARPPLRTNDPNLEGKVFDSGKTYYMPDSSKIEPIQTGADFNVPFELMKGIQDSIRRQMKSQVLPDKSRMGNNEVDTHKAEYYREMSVHGSRLEEEFLEPAIRAIFRALQGAEKLAKKLPDGTPFNIDDNPICLDMNSIDTRVKFQLEADRIVQTMMTVGPLPGAQRHIDPIKAARYLYDLNKMPAEIMVPIEEVEAAFKAEQEAKVIANSMAAIKGQLSSDGAKELGEGAAHMEQAAPSPA